MKKILYAIGTIILMIIISYVAYGVYTVSQGDKGVLAEPIDTSQIVCVTFPC